MMIGIEWKKTGVGCCAGDSIFKGWSKGFDDCKKKCVDQSNCGWINYFDSKWCSVIPKTSDCSKLSSEKSVCGSTITVHVHKYLPRHGNTLFASI